MHPCQYIDILPTTFPSRNRESTVLNKFLSTHNMKRTAVSYEFINNSITSFLTGFQNSEWRFQICETYLAII